MVFNSKISIILLIFIFFSFFLSSCLSYQVLTEIDGTEVVLPKTPLTIGKTTLTEALDQCGAPRKIIPLDHHFVLIYQRTVSNSKKLSLGIPFYNTMSGYDVSTNGGVSNSDTLVLVFTAQGTLDHYTYEEESQNPFFKTLFQD